MAWPPAAGSTTFTARTGTGAPTTIAWGTDGIYASVIVVSAKSELMLEEIKIENGTGLTAETINLKDGQMMEITVIDDRSITFPDWMTTVTLIDPQPTGAGGTSTTFQVLSNNYQAERKKEGQRTLQCKKYTLITPS